MKRRIQGEGFRELLAFCQQLKLPSADGRFYRTDAADTETLPRIIQSIPSPNAEPVKQWLARVGAKRLEDVTRPLPVRDTATAIVTVPKPAERAPALAWAEYHEQLASLYRRAAAYEAQLAYVDAKLDEHDAEIDELHSRVEGMEEGMRLLPEILERLGPQTLTSEHQATIKNMARRLSDLSGIAYATIYSDLNAAFHVGRYRDIPDARWAEITAWFERRIETAEKRRQREHGSTASPEGQKRDPPMSHRIGLALARFLTCSVVLGDLCSQPPERNDDVLQAQRRATRDS